MRACVFAGSFFALLFLSNYWSAGLPRYDFLLVGALLLQIFLVQLKIETTDEVKVIFLFHLIGFALESFKTHPSIGSWSYPEFAYTKIGGVPLYSGFMYSAVASYINQAWRLFDLKLRYSPPGWLFLALGALGYANFFTHHFIGDYRWFIIAAVLLAFWKTSIYFTSERYRLKMPLSLGFLLIAFFIWIAENISTLLGAWQYPDQVHSWHVVGLGKISSWFMLVIISVNLIVWLKMLKWRQVLQRQGRLPGAAQMPG